MQASLPNKVVISHNIIEKLHGEMSNEWCRVLCVLNLRLIREILQVCAEVSFPARWTRIMRGVEVRDVWIIASSQTSGFHELQRGPPQTTLFPVIRKERQSGEGALRRVRMTNGKMSLS